MDLKKPETKCNITNALQKFGCTLNKALTFLNVIPLFPPQLMIYLTLLLLAFSSTFFLFFLFFFSVVIYSYSLIGHMKDTRPKLS